MLHLAVGQQHRKKVRWEMVPFLLLMLSYRSHDQLQQEECEVGDGPLAVAVVVLHLADSQQHRKSVRWDMVPLL